MPAYGKVKVDTITYDLSGTATDVSVSNIATKASPTFTGTVTIPTPTAGDNSTKAASTAFVVASFATKASPTFTGTINAADLVLSGDLTVNGSTTTIDTTTLQVEDKNIQIGKVSTPSDATADGGGLTLLGATNKTWNWVNSTDAWTSSEHIHLGDDKKLLVGTGSDLSIYHDTNNSFISSITGNLKLVGNANILIEDNQGDTLASFNPNSSVDLYHNNVKKIETSATGCTVTGTLAATAVTGDGSGLTNLPPGNTFTAVADGAIAAGKPCIIKSDGKVAQVAETLGVVTNPAIDTNGVAQGGTGSSYHDFGNGAHDNMAYDPVSDMTLLIWRNTNASGTNLYYRMYESTGGGFNEITAARSSAPDETNTANFACCSLSNRRFAVCYEVTSKMKIQIGQVASDGSNITWGSSYYIDGQSGTAGSYREPHLVAIGNDRIALFARAQNTLCEWTQNRPGILVGDVTSTNVWNFRDGTAIDGTHNCDGQWRDITYDSTNDIIAFVWRRDSTDTNDYIMGGRVSSGTSPTFTFGTPLQHTTGTVKNRVRYNSVKNIFVTAWESSSLFYIKAHTINSTTLAVTAGTAVNWNHGMAFKSLNLVTSNEGGAFSVVIGSTDSTTRIVSASFASTNNLTITLNSSTNQPVCSNYGSAEEACCVYVAHTGRVLSVVRSGSGSAASMVLGTNKTTSAITNQTNGNFIGFAQSAISDTNSGTIQTVGAISENQSGLTPASRYYVKDDGTLVTDRTTSTSKGGGVAIASDKLVIDTIGYVGSTYN